MLSEVYKDKNRKESQKIRQLVVHAKEIKSLRENEEIQKEISSKINLKSQTLNISSKDYSLDRFCKSLR